MNLPAIPVAVPALRAFEHRRKWTRSGEDHRLRPWAALALRCGADPAAVSPDAPPALEDYLRAGLSEAMARACVADDLCPLPQVVAELATARDAALDALPLAASAAPASTSDLVVLAIHLGCPGYQPQRRKEAA